LRRTSASVSLWLALRRHSASVSLWLKSSGAASLSSLRAGVSRRGRMDGDSGQWKMEPGAAAAACHVSRLFWHFGRGAHTRAVILPLTALSRQSRLDHSSRGCRRAALPDPL
jgi:hypothetical protein